MSASRLQQPARACGTVALTRVNELSDIIVFGEDWHGLPSSTQHLAKALAKRHRILWINSIGLRQPKFTRSDGFRAIKKLIACFFRRKETQHRSPKSKTAGYLSDNIHVVNILTWPAPSSLIVRKLCAFAIAWQARKAMRTLNFERPVLWLSLPTAADACRYIPHKSCLYYCCDDFSSLAGVDHKTVTQHEESLIKKTDYIIASQESLQSKWPSKNSYLLTHGVDYSLFASPSPRAADFPKNSLVAGFYGSIAEWLDQDLVVEMAQQLTHWTFVFIGKATVDISQLKRCSNITFLGPKPHHELPTYSQHWAASLLSFKECQQITHCNPLKLREYLAAGPPVVSKRFPAAEQYRDVVTLAENANDFVVALNAIQHGEKCPQIQQARKKRQLSVAQESWAQRAQQITQWLEA